MACFNEILKYRFVKRLEKDGGIRRTAKSLPIDYATVKRHRRSDPLFNEMIDLAIEKHEKDSDDFFRRLRNKMVEELNGNS